jgi:hypothetical protein
VAVSFRVQNLFASLSSRGSMSAIAGWETSPGDTMLRRAKSCCHSDRAMALGHVSYGPGHGALNSFSDNEEAVCSLVGAEKPRRRDAPGLH